MEWHLSSVGGKKSSPSTELNKNYNRVSTKIILIWGDEVNFSKHAKVKYMTIAQMKEGSRN